MPRRILKRQIVEGVIADIDANKFTAQYVDKELRKHGITEHTPQAINAMLAKLYRDGFLDRVASGVYMLSNTPTEPSTPVHKQADKIPDKFTAAELGKSIMCYIDLLKMEIADLKKRLDENPTFDRSKL